MSFFRGPIVNRYWPLAPRNGASVMNRRRELVLAFDRRIWNGDDEAAADALLAEDFAFRGSLGAEMRGTARPSAITSGLCAESCANTVARSWSK